MLGGAQAGLSLAREGLAHRPSGSCFYPRLSSGPANLHGGGEPRGFYFTNARPGAINLKFRFGK